MRRLLTAYLFASLASVVTALVGDELLWQFGVYIPQAVAIMLTWLCIAGLPSLFWAQGHLSRVLGVKPPPELRIVGQRNIPVFGDIIRTTIPVADEIVFHTGTVVISEPEMLDFLRRAWRRQMRGEAPLARSYWCGQRRMEREEYEAYMTLLTTCNLIHGQRRQGSRNRLRWSPVLTLNELKYRSAR